jgi:hypothetical protein
MPNLDHDLGFLGVYFPGLTSVQVSNTGYVERQNCRRGDSSCRDCLKFFTSDIQEKDFI